ncbi:MAG: chemotaxis protein CheB [Endomicrobiales bacterium]|nr:chemotaxis protein CheB [Endomicrobiales bacterium]
MRVSFSKNIIIIGASAGGPRALDAIFSGMPKINASVIIVQHMPLCINESLRRELGAKTDMNVKIPDNNEYLQNETVYIAPSKIHLKVVLNEKIRLECGNFVNFVMPSIDVAMQSMQKIQGYHFTGIILTGMGKDGAAGISHIKEIGGVTIAQEYNSCALHYMPKAAIATKKVDFMLTPRGIRDKIIELFAK